MSSESTPAPESAATRSPRRGMCAAVLSLEAITIALSTPVMIGVGDISTRTALLVGLGLAVACLVVAGLLRSEAGYAAGINGAGQWLREPPHVSQYEKVASR